MLQLSPTMLFALAAGLVIVLAGLLILNGSLRMRKSDDISRRLVEYTLPVEAEEKRKSFITAERSRELSGTFGSRIIVPSFKRLGKIFGRLTPASSLETISRQLVIAGSPMGLGPREFYGIRLALMLIGAWMSFIIINRGFNQTNIMLGLVVFIICGYLPTFWLKSRIHRRQDRIRKGLPDALDMLSVCAEAGLGFDQSMQRVSQYWKTPLGVEFSRVVSEMEMGISRRDALHNLSDRLDISELSSFIAVILQSDQLGMSITDTLTAQAKQMRIERRFRAQEQARKAPLKMLFPMMFFILPAMFAVVLGPSIPIMRETIQMVLQNTAK